MKILDILCESPPMWRYVYHITTVDRLPLIMKNGLTPTTRSTGVWDHLTYDASVVFVVTRKTQQVLDELLTMLSNKFLKPGQTHEDWGDEDWDNYTNSLKLLTIDLSKCSNIDMTSDPNAGQWVHSKRITGNIPPEAVINVEPVNFSWAS